ncbi:MAG: 6-hydroxymethylpterin diphosphokinase MptE-like protein [Nitrososphaerales archaeon]
MPETQENPTSFFPLGELWYLQFYREIIESLDLSEERDIQSRDLLSRILEEKQPEFQYNTLEAKIKSNLAVLIGAGPSLKSDLSGLEGFISSTRPFIAAADGAADALSEMGVEPDVILTDLDSCSESLLVEKSRSGTGVVVHAHGDNIELTERIVKKLGTNLFGTTQATPLQNVHNIGGFTDGDRSCYFLSHFEPRVIIIAGMDFGVKEGEYSKSRVPLRASPLADFKRRKLEWGKVSLEFLIQSCPAISFINVTKWGEEIKGAEKLDYSQLSQEFE